MVDEVLDAEIPASGEDPTPGRFPATRWTRVVAANGKGGEAERALNELCEAYWYPLYAFVRRQGKSAEDAQDLTQGFFADLLRTGSLGRADREKGRLRSFLLGAMKNHLAQAHRRETAGKRGGGVRPLSIDEELAERRYRNEPRDDGSPDRLFERRWALDLLERVIDRLGAEYRERQLGELFEALAPLLASQEDADYEQFAERFDMKAGAVRTALSRMRKRYRECLILEVAETVASPDLVEEELAALISALRTETA